MNSENTKTAVRFRNVTKEFRLQQKGTRTLKSSVLSLFGKKRRPEAFAALREVDFTVDKGETLGIIGYNGAGKSTLLALVAGTISPSSGDIYTSGTISSLLELGAGFHPDLTGKENVFLYGAIMGLSQERMKARYENILEFADIGDFINQPVKHYSSGMYVRLGFAVAVEVDPDILLIDEVFAVGDVDFQKKCLNKMNEFREKGKTMVIVSHDLPTIQSISDRILLLDKGGVRGIGSPDSVVDTYQTLSRQRTAESVGREWGTGEAQITGVDIMTSDMTVSESFASGDTLRVRMHYEAKQTINSPVFGFALADRHGRIVFGTNTQLEDFDIPRIHGKGSVELSLGPLPMATGTYLLSFSIHSTDHKKNYHRIDNRFPIAVKSGSNFEGYCRIPCEWSIGS
jgi:ABC-type polysaccharide/polyol phosphate transport system ATPase subunit